ncbi:claudin-7-like [Styela clava]|uniref:claudin-7-like n=1 Tax=Styela clava TaxID=7725 RepID=UPI00193A7E9D|nr:claudin-7-like [Styela clava]
MASGVGIASLLAICGGWILTCIAVAIPYWQRNDPDDTINDSISQHMGLWIECTSFSTGNWECDDYQKFFLALPAMLQAGRGFGISALILGLVGLIMITFSIKQGICGASFYQTKRSRLIAGCLSLLSSLCIIAAASWYAHDIHREYTRQQMMEFTGRMSNSTTYVFGSALFIAWAGGALYLLGGILALCMSCEEEDEDLRRQPYVYKPEVNTVYKRDEEYV